MTEHTEPLHIPPGKDKLENIRNMSDLSLTDLEDIPHVLNTYFPQEDPWGTYLKKSKKDFLLFSDPDIDAMRKDKDEELEKLIKRKEEEAAQETEEWEKEEVAINLAKQDGIRSPEESSDSDDGTTGQALKKHFTLLLPPAKQIHSLPQTPSESAEMPDSTENLLIGIVRDGVVKWLSCPLSLVGHRIANMRACRRLCAIKLLIEIGVLYRAWGGGGEACALSGPLAQRDQCRAVHLRVCVLLGSTAFLPPSSKADLNIDPSVSLKTPEDLETARELILADNGPLGTPQSPTRKKPPHTPSIFLNTFVTLLLISSVDSPSNSTQGILSNASEAQGRVLGPLLYKYTPSVGIHSSTNTNTFDREPFPVSCKVQSHLIGESPPGLALRAAHLAVTGK
ncbi:hypothetical protein AAG570_006231 [Ranatra chinensis]|uniref:Uncharacterized protein n=1 Tax=Ranatra chinensis TaxID=642074 RepID=A0ABD0YTE4_9HEMI